MAGRNREDAGGGGEGSPQEVGSAAFISRVREEQMLVQRIELLEQAPLFSVLHPSDLRVLASRFHLVRYAKGDVILWSEPPKSDAANPPTEAAIDDLKRKLDELQNQLAELSKKP